VEREEHPVAEVLGEAGDGPRYWVLVLSRAGIQLFRGCRETLTPVAGDGSPMGRQAVLDAQIADRLLATWIGVDPEPLVVVGTCRRLASFCYFTRYRRRLVGIVRGEHGDTPVAELAWLVWPVVLATLSGGRAGTLVGLRMMHPAGWAPAFRQIWHSKVGRAHDGPAGVAGRQWARPWPPSVN
jgi:hypothetical protein